MTEQTEKRATLPVPEDIVFTHPIPYGGTTLERIPLHRPKAGELIGVTLADLVNGNVDAVLTVVAKAATIPVTVQQLRAVKASDIQKLVEATATVISGPEDAEEDVKTKDGRVPLLVPIELPEGEKLEELTLFSPDAGRLRGLSLAGLQDLDFGLIITLAERCSTKPLKPGTLRLLDPADLVKVGSTVTGFFAA